MTVNGGKPPVSSTTTDGKVTFSASQLQSAAKLAAQAQPANPASKPFGAFPGAKDPSTGLGTLPPVSQKENGLGNGPGSGNGNGNENGNGNGLGLGNGNGNGNGNALGNGNGNGNGNGIGNGNGKKQAPVSSKSAKAAKNSGQGNGQGSKTEKETGTEKGPKSTPPGQLNRYAKLRSELLKLQERYDSLQGMSENDLLKRALQGTPDAQRTAVHSQLSMRLGGPIGDAAASSLTR